jgi:imidazolonepropionase
VDQKNYGSRIQFGLKPKIHVNQFNSIGGIQAGVKYKALSVDHLEIMKPEDIEALKNTETMPVALPSCSYFFKYSLYSSTRNDCSGTPLALQQIIIQVLHPEI